MFAVFWFLRPRYTEINVDIRKNDSKPRGEEQGIYIMISSTSRFWEEDMRTRKTRNQLRKDSLTERRLHSLLPVQPFFYE
jgi:hypothetical protein|tara:strand:- start:343 stop:582 length:240 start_codon:yes stop_codon:yes gene_type:complete